MSQFLDEFNKLKLQYVQLEQEMRDDEAKASSLEKEAKAIREGRYEKKKELGRISALMTSTALQHKIKTEEQLATEARASADQLNAQAQELVKRLEEKEKQLEEKLASVSTPAE